MLDLEVIKIRADGLPKQTDRIAWKIKHTNHLGKQLKEKLLALLEKLSDNSECLCHGDFHPLNILYDGKKYWIIDWVDAAAGNPLADACRTYLIFKQLKQHLSRSAGIYLRAFCTESNLKQEDILAWLPVIAAARLDENMDDKSRNWLLEIANKIEDEAGRCEMQKRIATMSDIPVLVDLRKKQLIDEGGLPPVTDIDKQFADYFIAAIADGSFVSWVMEDDSEIVATSGICFYSLPPTFTNPTGRVAYITNMYTKNEYRCRGVATELLSMVVGEAMERGYILIRLHTSEYGKSIYKKAGFTDTDGFMALRL